MDYQLVNNALLQLASDVDASEAQGMAAGVLVIALQADVNNWLEMLSIDQDNSTEDAVHCLLTLFEQTRNSLNSDELIFEFDLLLPDDDEAITEQAEALGHWCQGFLYGIGFQQSSQDWSGEIGEIIKDLVEMSKIEVDDDSINDPDAEFDLMEIHEYLRASVFMVKDFFSEAVAAASH